MGFIGSHRLMTSWRRCFRIVIVQKRERTGWAIVLLIWICSAWFCQGEDTTSLIRRQWFAARTPHFQTYSCGVTQEVAKLTARLEQFRMACEALAGTQAVASPPIEVIAFPDHEWLERFAPLYQGQPINVAGFFHRDSDENIIVLSLTNSGSGALETIFHEYAHLLLRRNQQFWPMWLNEGMADIYAGFEVAGDHGARVGKQQELYLRILANAPLAPLSELFAVTHDSAEYNERERQGMFYAESWLLTHYLMIGNPARRSGLAEFTLLLRQGQAPLQAFTNAFRSPLSVMEKELARYSQQGRFESLSLAVRASLLGPQPMATRGVPTAEICFRLGDELLRVGREAEAESLFLMAGKLAPASPLSYEGLSFLAAERGHHQEAMENLNQAIRHGSTSFLAHYAYAREKLILSAPEPDNYTRLEVAEAAEVHGELETALKLMPEFGPAQHLLGFFQLLQGENLASAGQHLNKAIDLEPDNPAYPLTLAQLQLAQHNLTAARRTLEPLCRPYVNAKLRAHAEELLKGMAD
jgi:tetratricopeptide (TPR) repeat protein